jgi:hypothetical protein
LDYINAKTIEELKHERKTLIVGATTNPDRYAYKAAKLLNASGVDFVPIGVKKGEVFGKEIIDITTTPELKDVHTITLYINSQRQADWEEYLISIKPSRIIFNPGTENPEFQERARNLGIETLQACTLTMLSVGLY